MSPTEELAILARWCRNHRAEVVLELICPEAPRLPGPAGHVVVRLTCCLTGAAEVELAELAAAAAAVVLRVDGCATGAPPPGTTRLTAVLTALECGDRLAVWHDVPEGSAATARRPELSPTHLPLLRRQLGLWLRPTERAEETDPDVAESHRLVTALRRVLDAAAVPSTAGALDSDALALVSSGCVACGTCVRACPTQVLALDQASGNGLTETVARTHLAFDPAGCIGCRRCVTLCPVDALSDRGALSWADLLPAVDQVVLEELFTRPCGRCGSRFAGAADDALCLVCRKRRANPFGSSLPPRYVAPHVYRPPAAKPPAEA